MRLGHIGRIAWYAVLTLLGAVVGALLGASVGTLLADLLSLRAVVIFCLATGDRE